MTPTGAGRSKEEKKHGESRQTEDNLRNFYPVLVPPAVVQLIHSPGLIILMSVSLSC